MKKSKIIIKESQLIRLIYEAINSRNKSEPINFVTGGGDVNFVEYFGITSKDVKRAFFRNEGAVACSFMGVNPRGMKFKLINELTPNNLIAKEYHPCDYGQLELWMFFSNSKSHGDSSFYIALLLKNNGELFNGQKIGNIEVGDFIPTYRLSSETISIIVLDLMVKIHDQISGMDIKSRFMKSHKKKETSFF